MKLKKKKKKKLKKKKKKKTKKKKKKKKRSNFTNRLFSKMEKNTALILRDSMLTGRDERRFFDY